MYRKAVLFLAALLLLSACGLNINKSSDAPVNVVITVPPPVTQPTPLPTPAPSTSPGATGSDVASLAIFIYGYSCPGGVPPPANGAATIPPPCTEALATATPKRADGSDATNHGRALSWSANGVPAPDNTAVDVGIALIVPGPSELTFNRTVRVKSPRQTGTVFLVATLTAPDGRVHTASRSVVIQ